MEVFNMNILLVFFAIPLAVIILSIILESFINCPFKTSGIFFAIFIVLAFALGGTAELIVATIIYTLISFVSAVITRFVINRRCNCRRDSENNCNYFSNNCNSCNSCINNVNNRTEPFRLNDFNMLNELNSVNNLNGVENVFSGENNIVNSNSILNRENNLNSNNSRNICRRFR